MMIYFSRIENIDKEIIDNSALEKRRRYTWIDIFPLDGMPNNVFIRQIHKTQLLYRRLLLQYSNFSKVVNQNLPNRPLHERILIQIGNIVKPDKYLNTDKCLYKLDELLKKYDYDNSKYVVNFMGAYKFKEMFNKKIYDDKELYEFEGKKYYAPRDYDLVLSQMYGDYMTPPKDKDKHKHHISTVK